MHFGIRVELTLPDGRLGHFAFEVAARARGEFAVKEESCALGEDSYVVREGVVKSTSVPSAMPPASEDRLYLVNAAGLPQFRPVFDALSHMRFYNPNPDRMRALQLPDKGELWRDLVRVLSATAAEAT